MSPHEFDHDKLQQDIAAAMKAYAPIFLDLTDRKLVEYGATSDVREIFKRLRDQRLIRNFLVTCDERNNPPSVVAEGKLVISVSYILHMTFPTFSFRAVMEAGDDPVVTFDSAKF